MAMRTEELRELIALLRETGVKRYRDADGTEIILGMSRASHADQEPETQNDAGTSQTLPPELRKSELSEEELTFYSVE